MASRALYGQNPLDPVGLATDTLTGSATQVAGSHLGTPNPGLQATDNAAAAPTQLALPAGSSPVDLPPRNVFPSTADEFSQQLGMDPTFRGTTPDGTPRTRWEPNQYTRITMESHPEGLTPTDPGFNPRHHGEHYHVQVRPQPTTGWNNPAVQKLRPPGYTPGSGTGFLPGEPFPGT
jgi:hypothetical protein